MIRKSYHGAAKLALLSEAPIIPIGILGAFELGSVYSAFPRISREVVISIGMPMNLQAYYNRKDDKAAHEEIMEFVMKEIYELCGRQYPLYSENQSSLVKRNVETLKLQ